jgi:hypothetical protein
MFAKEFLMKKKSLLMGILAMALVFEMTFVGCDNGTTDTDDTEVSINLTTSGEFSFTDIPSKYNGKFAVLKGLFSNSTRIMIGYYGVTVNTSNPSTFSTITGVKIENGTVKIPLYTLLESSPVSSLQTYTGNDSAFVGILIYDSESISTTFQNYIAAAAFGTATGSTPTDYPVQFTSGKVSKSNNDATEKLAN